MNQREAELRSLTQKLLVGLTQDVFKPLAALVNDNPDVRPQLNPAFPFPRIIKIGFLDKGAVIEFQGPAQSDQNINVHIEDRADDSLLQFLGIDESDIASSVRLYYGLPSFNTAFYLGDAIDRLNELSYDYTATGEIMGINGYNDIEQATEPSYWSNVTLFWTDVASAQLHVRHIDFLVFFPIEGEAYHIKLAPEHLRQIIINLPTPEFDIRLSHELNRFIELLHIDGVDERRITDFLSLNPEILQLAIGCHDLNPQVLLEWQVETDMPNLQPDFMPVGMDGYANILDFKRMTLERPPMVGRQQRRRPGSGVEDTMAQLAQYDEWCSQLANRRWLEATRGIKVLHPQRYVIMGTTQTFPAADRQRLRSLRSTTVYTYDELVDLVRYQLYRVK